MYKWVQLVIAETKRSTVLPALHYGRAQIVTAKIEQTLGVVRKLNAADIEWLRNNQPEILRGKVAQLGEQLSLLAIAVEPETVSLDDVEAA